MPQQLLDLLKLCLLALLYLFFLRVARAVWVEVGGPGPRRRSHKADSGPSGGPSHVSVAPPGPASPGPSLGPTGYSSHRQLEAVAAPVQGRRPELVVTAPAELAGQRYLLQGELTIGRASGCQILVEDNYVSQLHARLFAGPEGTYVEDLGSTNGTFVLPAHGQQSERHKVAGPRLLERGDQVQVGSTVMELVL